MDYSRFGQTRPVGFEELNTLFCVNVIGKDNLKKDMPERV
jgi:hypothetical protein